MSALRLTVPSTFYATELSRTEVQLSLTSIGVPSAGVSVVTVAAPHGLAVGDRVTFSGVTGTGVTGLNGTTYKVWKLGDAADANTTTCFRIQTALAGTPAGTQKLEKLYFPSAGTWVGLYAANLQVEYCPTNNGESNDSTSSTWRILNAVSTAGHFHTDGLSVRLRAVGASGTTVLSRIQ